MTKTIRILALMAICQVGSLTAYSNSYAISDLSSHIIAPSFSGLFDLDGSTGFKPGAEAINSASVVFAIANFTAGSPNVEISLDGSFFSSGKTFSSDFLGGNVTLGFAADTSILRYTITSSIQSPVPKFLQGSFLKFSTDQRPTDPPTRVPDGGTTMALLGIGLVGVGCLRRRLQA